MIAVSQAFATQIEQDTRTFSARFLLIDNGTETELTGSVRRLTMGKGTGAEAEFGVGTLYSNNIEAEFWRCETPLQNATLAVELGVQLPDGSFEYVRAGVFDITRVSTDAYSTIVIGYGPLTTKFGGTYTGTGDKSIAAILADVQAETGCTIDAGAFPAATTALHPAREMTGLTHREVVAYIAGLLGGYVTETASGTVVMQAMPTAVSMAVDADRSTQLASFNDYDFTVAGILVDAGFASGSPNVTLANPYMTQALFDRLVSELVGYTYRPGTVSLSLGDIRLEAGDLLEVTDLNGVAYHVPCLNIVHTFDGGLSTLVTAPGESELQTMANTTGAMQRAVNTAQTTATEAKEKLDGLTLIKEGTVYVDGGKVYVDQAFVNSIFAQNITATGTIKGATLEGATLRGNAIDISASGNNAADISIIGELGKKYADTLLRLAVSGNTDASYLALRNFHAILSSPDLQLMSDTAVTLNAPYVYLNRCKIETKNLYKTFENNKVSGAVLEVQKLGWCAITAAIDLTASVGTSWVDVLYDPPATQHGYSIYTTVPATNSTSVKPLSARIASNGALQLRYGGAGTYYFELVYPIL